MKIKPEELDAAGYVLIDELPHQDLVPFLKRYLKAKTTVVRLYNQLSAAMLALIIGYMAWAYFQHGAKITQGLIQVSYGASISFLLIPIHEVLHGLAYRYLGAPKTSYMMNLKKFYFAALADKFVCSAKEFRIVALAPFTVITCLCLVLALWLPYAWSLTVLSTMLTHSLFCSGDFGLLSYLEAHKDSEIVTYDDLSSNSSYFFKR